MEWFDFDSEVKNLVVPEISNLHIRNADIFVATSWTTAHLAKPLSDDKGKKCYFIQHYEAFKGSKEAKSTYFFGYQNIVISEWLKEKLEKGLGVPVKALINNGMELETFKPQKSPTGRNRFSLIMMYHVSDWKGIPDALVALKIVKEKYPQLKVTFFSTYPRGEDVFSWVEFIQKPTRLELREMYNEHSIFLSSSWIEGFGLPGLEAMACGCAVVTTDSLGVRDYAIHEKTALLSPPKKPENLATNIIRLLEDDGLRLKLTNEGLCMVNKFDWKDSVAKMEKVFIDSLE